MPNTSTISFSLVVGFIVFITVRGELPAYLCVIGLGSKCQPPPTTATNPTTKTSGGTQTGSGGGGSPVYSITGYDANNNPIYSVTGYELPNGSSGTQDGGTDVSSTITFESE